MSNITIFILKALRKLYAIVFQGKQLTKPECEHDPECASQIIYDALISDKPCMISRFGAVEISVLNNYLGVTGQTSRDLVKFIKGETPEWWWNEGLRYSMSNNAGFFPATNENLLKFGEVMLKCIPSVDILGSWQPFENNFIHYFPNAKLVSFVLLDPYWSKSAWTRALAGKRVLVVHPFAELIEQQYRNNRNKLFRDKDILPLFDLKVVKAVQSIGGTELFSDWFQALEHMKNQIDNIDFDICLLGCGAYGLPLAAYIKNKNKKAVHMGGTLQLLFGIWGKRWDNPEYAEPELKRKGAYLTLFNEFWILPGIEFRPSNYKHVESGCYW